METSVAPGSAASARPGDRITQGPAELPAGDFCRQVAGLALIPAAVPGQAEARINAQGRTIDLEPRADRRRKTLCLGTAGEAGDVGGAARAGGRG